MLQARGEAKKTAQDNLVWAVWHIEALARMKKLPAFDQFAKRRPKNKGQTPEELLAMVRIMNTAFGGTVIEKKD